METPRHQETTSLEDAIQRFRERAQNMGVDKYIGFAHKVFNQLRITKFVHESSLAVRRVDRTLGVDKEDNNPLAFRQGAALGAVLANLMYCNNHDVLRRILAATRLVSDEISVEYTKDIANDMAKKAVSINEIGTRGLVYYNGAEDLIDEFIDRINPDVTKHNALKVGAGFVLSLFAISEQMIVAEQKIIDLRAMEEAVDTIDWDRELANLLDE